MFLFFTKFEAHVFLNCSWYFRGFEARCSYYWIIENLIVHTCMHTSCMTFIGQIAYYNCKLSGYKIVYDNMLPDFILPVEIGGIEVILLS